MQVNSINVFSRIMGRKNLSKTPVLPSYSRLSHYVSYSLTGSMKNSYKTSQMFPSNHKLPFNSELSIFLHRFIDGARITQSHVDSYWIIHSFRFVFFPFFLQFLNPRSLVSCLSFFLSFILRRVCLLSLYIMLCGVLCMN